MPHGTRPAGPADEKAHPVQVHLFGGEEIMEEYPQEPKTLDQTTNDYETRLAIVEQELAELKAAFESIMKDLNG
jgi:uncharacterized protein YceH (UPF0502 family)